MTGVERLKSMIEEGPLKKPLFKIYMYLKTRNDMDEKFLNPEKSMTQMYDYIKEQVRKQAVDGVAMIEDAVVYGLAIHYFDPWRRKWQPTPASLPGKSHGQRNLVDCSPWGRKESGTTERLTHLLT